jgi:hypothetical protein
MSLAKASSDGLKDRECEKMALRERPPIPYVPEKDSVQDTVSSFKDNHLKTLINKGMELQVSIWHSGTRKAFLIHMGSAREAIEKKGYFKSYEEYSGAFANKRDKIKELRSQLTELKETSETSAETLGQTGTFRKSGKKSRKTTVEASEPSRLSLSKPWMPQRKP